MTMCVLLDSTQVVEWAEAFAAQRAALIAQRNVNLSVESKGRPSDAEVSS